MKEGELYKSVTVHGRTFELRYGYYDEKERFGRYSEPIPIYPDFTRDPQYTDDGQPFVTAMQDPCEHFIGRDRSIGCYGCSYFSDGDDLLGVCACKSNRRNG